MTDFSKVSDKSALEKNTQNNLNFKAKILCLLASITRIWLPRVFKRLPRLIYHPDNRQGDFFETIISYDKDLKIHINTSSPIEWQVFFSGYYELPVTNIIKKYLPKRGTFVDVGAHTGVYSLIASKIAEKVIAIEPVKNFSDRLRKNCELNNITNVSILPFVVSDKEEDVPFYIPKGEANSALGHCGRDDSQLRLNEVEEIKVKTKTLDEILKNEKRIDFIKIDVEGYDGKVIMGSLDTIKKHHPVIVFEFVKQSLESSGVTFEMIEKNLKSLGYDLKKIDGVPDNCNMLCLPQNREVTRHC